MKLSRNKSGSDHRPTALRRGYRRIRDKFGYRIRDKAIERARTRIYLHGRRPEDYEPDILETIVKEEEDRIIGEYKSRGIIGLMAVLGLSLFP